MLQRIPNFGECIALQAMVLFANLGITDRQTADCGSSSACWWGSAVARSFTSL